MEHLAIDAAMRIFRHMLEARHFTILTDHKPLTFAFQQKSDKCSPRQFNYVEYISQVTTDIHHISGQDNIVADALPRVEPLTAPVDLNGLAADQDGDDKLRTLLVCHTTLQLEKLLIPGTSIELYCDTSAVKPHPYALSPLRRRVFDSHSHPGRKATAKLVSQRFMCPAIQKECSTWARACQPSQHSKVWGRFDCVVVALEEEEQ